jgi:hypothetical protein
MPIGIKFSGLATTTDINNLLGAAENADGITPGNKFKYSSDTALDGSSASNAVVPTQLAVKTYTSNVPRETNKAWVDQTLGNDTTGIVSKMGNPFATYNGAAAAITTAAYNNTFLAHYTPGIHTEATIVLKPYVYIGADALYPTNIDSAASYMLPDSSFGTGNSEMALQNVYTESTGINFDLNALGGAFYCFLDLINCYFQGDITFNGRAGSNDILTLKATQTLNDVTIDSATLHAYGSSLTDLTITSTNDDASANLQGTNFTTLSITGTTNFVDVILRNSPVDYINMDGTLCTIVSDEASIGSAVINYTSGATSAQIQIINNQSISTNDPSITTITNTLNGIKNWNHTGLISCGTSWDSLLSINTDDTLFDVAACSAQVMDLTNPSAPIQTFISWPSQIGLSTPYLATAAGTWIGWSKSTSTIVTSPTDFTLTQLHDDIIRLGRLSHFGNTVITGVYQLPLFYYGDLEYLCFGTSFGVINLSGNVITANGANLKLDKGQGVSYRVGAYVTVDANNPNYPITANVPTFTFLPAYQSATAGKTTLSTATTDLDPEYYDDGTGTLHAVTPTYYTIQTTLFFPANGTYTMFMLYGQTEYATFTAAKIALRTYTPIINPDLAGGNIRAMIIIQQGTTDLATAVGAGTAYISSGSVFGTLGIGGSAGGSTGGSDVASVFGRTGNVVATANDYLASQLNWDLTGTNIVFFGMGGNDANNGLSWETRKATLSAAYTLAQTAFGTPSATNRVVCYCQDAGYYGSGGSSSINFGLTQWIDIYAPEATLAYSLYDPSGNRSITAKIIGASDLTSHSIYFNNSQTCYINAEQIIANTASYFGISITGSAMPTLHIDVKNCDSFRDNNTTDVATVYGNFDYIGNIILSPVTVGSIFANACPSITDNGNTTCEIFCPNYVKSGHTIYVDINRTDAYIPNGTEIMPYKTFSAAVAAMGTPSVGFAIHIATGTYTEASLVTLPNVPIVIYGNEAIITFASGLTIQYPSYVINDLNIVGNVTMSSTAATGQGLSNGGSVTGDITYNGGRTGFKNTILLGGLITVTSPAFWVANICTVTSQITGDGQIIIENCQINTGKTTPLITSTTGGTLIVVNSLITNTSTGGGISCNNGANGVTAINGISNCIITVASGAPIACGTAVTIIVKCTVNGTPTGTGYIGSNFDIIGGGTIMGLGSDATGDMYYRAATTLLTRIAPNSTATKMYLSQTSSGAPAWSTAEAYLASSNIIWFGKGGSDTNNGLTWGNRLLNMDAAYNLAVTAFGTLGSTNQAVVYCPDAGRYDVGTLSSGLGATYVHIIMPVATVNGGLPVTSGNEIFINIHKVIGGISFFNGAIVFLKIDYLFGSITQAANYGSTIYFDIFQMQSFIDSGGTGTIAAYGKIGYMSGNITATSRSNGNLYIGKCAGTITNASTNFAIRCDNYASQAYNTNYYNSAGVLASLAPNTAITPTFLSMTGTGAAGNVPMWRAHQTYNSIFVTRFGTDNTELYVTNYTATATTGWINVAADFPTIAAVVDKGCYVVPSGVTVVDNDVTKTNTGMSFTGPLQISWDATNTRWVRRTGKTLQDPVCSIAVASYLNYYYGATYGIECLDAATYNFADQFVWYGSLHAPLATINSTGFSSIETTTNLSLYFDKMTTTPSDAFGSGGILLTGSGNAYIQCNSAMPLNSGSPTKMFSATAGSLTVIANTIRNTNTTDYTIYTSGTGAVWVNANRMRGELFANAGTIYCTATITTSITMGGAGTIYLNNKLIQSVSISTWVCAATASTPTTIIRLSKDIATNTVTMSLDSWSAVGNSSTAAQITAAAVIPAAFRPTTGPAIGAIAAHDTDGIYSDVGSWGSAVIDSSGNIAIMKTAAYPVTGDWNPGTNNFGFYSSTIQWNTAQ